MFTVRMQDQRSMQHGMRWVCGVHNLTTRFCCGCRRLTHFLADKTAVLPESLAFKSGLTKDHAKRNANYGGGYPVLVEGLHHLHCLVSLITPLTDVVSGSH